MAKSPTISADGRKARPQRAGKIAALASSCYAFAMNTPHPLMAMFLVSGLLVGCRAKSTTEPDAAAPVAADDSDKDSNASDVSIDKNLSEMCNLPTPNFEYDSARLSSSAESTLNALAECFISGPAKGKSMLIVGHADPRGDEEYNYALGQRRADTVAGFLGDRGLSRSRIESSSRGELDATGTEESSWRRDRRVEIGLAD